MAAGDFTSSALLRSQIRLGDMFAQPTIAQTELLEGSAATARALLMRQRARINDRLLGGRCVGIRAWYVRPHAEGSADFATPTTCATPCGDDAETIHADYDTVVLAESQAKVTEDFCDNELTFAEALATQQAHMMSKLRKDLNRLVVIPALEAATQANLDTFINSTWDYTANTPRIVVPEADFTWENFPEFETVMMNNNFGEAFWVSGRLFHHGEWIARMNVGNEGFRNQANAYATQQMYFDLRDLDQTMTRKTAFAVDANSYAFWNAVISTPTPTQGNTDSGRIWTWAQPDPFLVWNRNGVMTPVVYEFEMAETCVGRNSLKTRTTQHCLYARLLGGFEFAPTGPNGEKGALQFSVE